MANDQSRLLDPRPATIWMGAVAIAGIALLWTPHTVKVLLDPTLRAHASVEWFTLNPGVCVLTWLTAFGILARWRWARWAGVIYFVILLAYGVRLIARPFRSEVAVVDLTPFVLGVICVGSAAALAWGLGTRESIAAYFSGSYRTDEPLVSGREPLALASAILGGLAFVLGPLTGIPAVVCGHIAKRRIHRNPEASGRRLATAGLITGYVFSVVSVLTIALLFLSPASSQR